MTGEIKTYKTLTQKQLDAINSIKDLEADIAELFKQLKEDIPGINQRGMAEARTCVQTGLMWATRAISQPSDPFEVQ